MPLRPGMIDRTVEAVVFDWDGTAVAGRRASARVRRRVLGLTAAGVDVAVVSGTDVEDIDRQLRARPAGPGRLWLCVNAGSELFEVTLAGPQLTRRRVASAAEDAALDAAAARTIDVLRRRGLAAGLVASGLNRRKISLLQKRGRSGPPPARIAGLRAAVADLLRQHGFADLSAVVRIATESALAAGLRCPHITSDAEHLEIGLTSKSDSLRELLTLLARRGVGPGLVLVVSGESGPIGGMPAGDSLLLIPEAQRAIAVSVGAEPAGAPSGVRQLSSGPPGLLGLLDEQTDRRRARRVPSIDEDPAWIIREDSGDPLRHRIAETICTLGAAGLATRGSVEEFAAGATPLVVADGIYRGHGADELLPGPLWTGLLIAPVPDRDERVLDLRTGVLARRERGGNGTLRTLRFASATRPGVAGLRAEAALGRLRPGDPLQQPNETPMSRGRLGPRHWARTGPPQGPGVAALAEQHTSRAGSTRTLERIAAYATDRRRQPALSEANSLLDAAAEAGFDRMLAEHRAAWAERWDAVDIRIPDDQATQLGVRFALFQLWCNVNRHDESAVGARGLSGRGYAGHVFWDADVFVLPAMVAIDPRAAQAMVRYRLRRLDAARSHAAAGGYDGARFPWESAATGEDVTPRSGRLGGTIVPIRTGQLEEHVTADVAWAAAHCSAWTGSAGGRYHRAEMPLLVETARYWASRARRDAGGRVHIDAVIGPDEYHESVNDNAYTNVMARWNLRAGADAADRTGIAADTRRWRELADGLVDGYDAATGRYEQFAGYFGLESLLVAQFAEPPVAADLLIGLDRLSGSQIIKQPDVLMLHHLVPSQVQPGSLEPNLDFYGPRTAHGSSLSPAVTATLLARAGRADDALAMLGLALTLDIEDTTGMTAAGLHIANLAGVWQAMLSGFAGIAVHAGVLTIDPRLPTAWGSLEIRFRCLGRHIRLSITRDDTVVHTDGPLQARLAGDDPRAVSGTTRLGRPALRTDAEKGRR
jgi:trehalose/maltose hydrolase-like predicted phosphorylase